MVGQFEVNSGIGTRLMPAPRKQLSLKERNLKLRPITWVFNPDPQPNFGKWFALIERFWKPSNCRLRSLGYFGMFDMKRLDSFFCIEPTQLNQDTVYGKRDGAVTGLALIYNQKGNLFKQTPGWKTGVVHNVSMLQRNEMWKPPCVFWLSIMAFLLIHVRVGPQLLKHFSGRPSHQNTLNISHVPPASIGFPRQAQPRASFLTWAELSRTSRKWSKSLGIGGWFCPTKSQLQTQGCLETIPGWWLD